MKQLYCSATPFAIGFQHGQAAKVEIDRGLVFYRDLFQKTSGLSWSEVCDTAAKFEPVLQKGWPQYCEEMRGRSASWLLSLKMFSFFFIIYIQSRGSGQLASSLVAL